MKKMIKNLMLVAVAAMAFVACSEVSVEVDNLTNKTIITGVATIDTDDTRSGFVGSETDENGNTVYKSAWDGGEEIKIFYDSQETTTTIDDEGKGKFNVELEGAPSFITVCSPAEAWVSSYTCNIPAEQTPRTDSVDPAAHILQAQNVSVSNGSAFAQMVHQVGYGKMTVNTPAEFVIDYVEVELNGDWYDYPKTLNYTINADNVEDNVFWFATDVVEVSDFTVTAYDAKGNAYTKSVTIPEGRELKFQYGRVSTFSVSNLEKYEYVAPAFTSAKYNGNVSDKIIKLSGEELGELWINFYGNNALLSSDNWINVGQYSINNGLYFGGNYGQYKPAGYSEWCTSTPNSFTLDVSIVDGQYMFVVNADYSNWDEGVTLVNAVYHGDIEGLDYPDLRTKLPTPVVTTTISGKTITMNWNEVENAESYYIKCTSNQDFEPISTTDTTVTITVSAYEYHSFSIKAVVSDDNEIYRSSDETYVEYNDPREYLPSPSNVTATIDGPNATISWDAVEGADGYRVEYYLDGNNSIIVDGTSITLELGYDVENVWVYVFAIADEDNDKFRSSQSYDAYVEVNTGKDPNVFADHILDKVTVKSDHIEFYREYVGDGTLHYANTTESLRIYLHANNRGNDYISTGEYTCVGTGASVPTSAGTVNMRYNSDSYWNYYSTANTSSTLSVSFVDNEYVIIATINGETWGYKGMPEDWVAPETGGEEPENPGDSIDLTGYTKCNLDSFTAGNAEFVAKFTLSDAVYGDQYTFSIADVNGINVSQKVVKAGEYTFVESFNSCEMEASDFYYLEAKQNATGTVTVYNQDGTYTIKVDAKIGYSSLKFYYQGTL